MEFRSSPSPARHGSGWSPVEIVERSKGTVHTIDGVSGPENPVLIDAGRWEFAASAIGYLLEEAGVAPRPGPSLSGRSAAARRRDDDDVPGAAPGPAVHPVAGASRKAVEAEVIAIPIAPPKAGKVVMPATDAWDRERLRLAAAPVVVFWSEPDTQACKFAIVSRSTAGEIRDSAFRCDAVNPHQGGAIMMSYEDGKLGTASGPGLQFFDAVGAVSASPVYFIEGRTVSPETHALGRQQPFQGAALGSALIAEAAGQPAPGFGFPGGETVCSLDGLDSEFERALGIVRGWLSGREPNLRHRERVDAVNDADARLARAAAEMEAARRQIAMLRDGGAGAVSIDFAGFSGPAGDFAGHVAAALGKGTGYVRLADGDCADAASILRVA